VGNDQGGASDHQVFEGLLDFQFRFTVQGRRGFIQDQDGGILEERPGDAETLPLASGKDRALLADDRVETVRQLVDELESVGRTGRLDDFLLALLNVAVGDVVAHGIVKEDGLLGNDADLGPQRGDGDVAEVGSVDEDGAPGDFIEAGDEVDEGGFAGTAHPHDGDQFPGPYREVDVLQHRFVAVVEMDMPEFDAPGNGGQWEGARALDDFRGRVENVVDPVGGGNALLERQVHAAQALDRFVEQDQGGQEGEKIARGRDPLDHAVAAIADDGHNPDAAEEFHERRQQGVHGSGFHGVVERPGVLFAEALLFVFFHPEGLDDAIAANGFVENDRNIAHRFETLGADGAELLPEFDDGQEGEGQDEDRDDGQLPVPVEDHSDQPDHTEGVPDDAGGAFLDGRLDLADVVGDA